MNRIFSIIWNPSLRCWVVASELVRRKGKKSFQTTTINKTHNSRKSFINHPITPLSFVIAVILLPVTDNSAFAGQVNDTSGLIIGVAPNCAGNVSATGNRALAFGCGFTAANSTDSIAIGVATTVTGTSAIGLGNNIVVNGNDAISIGSFSMASGNSTSLAGSTTVIGTRAQGFQFSTALGGNAIAGTAPVGGIAGNGASTAVGVNADATGNRAVAIGASSKATGSFSTANGTLANAAGDNSLAAGQRSSASADNSSALGGSSTASSTESTAVGEFSQASGIGSVALGAGTSATTSARASADGAIAVGNNSNASAKGALAIGQNTNSTGVNAIAIGTGALATGSVALGTNALAGGGGAAFGDNADSGGSTSSGAKDVTLGTALGNGAINQVNSGVALGNRSVADRATITALANPLLISNQPNTATNNPLTITTNVGAVSVGTNTNLRQITNVAGGTADTDAVNVGQIAPLATAITNINNGAGIKYFHAKSTLADSSATGTDSVAVGPAAVASAASAIAVGNGAKAAEFGSVAVGQAALSDPNSAGSVSIGWNAKNTAASGGIAIGLDSSSGATSALAVGRKSQATGQDTVALGFSAVSSKINAIALGSGAKATDANSVALGQGAVTAAANKVAGANINGTAFSFAGPAPGSVVSFGAAGSERQLTHVAAGRLSSTSTDAVNGSQLFASNTAIDSLGNTVTGIGTTVTNIGNTVNNINNGGGIKYFHASSTLADSSATGTDSVAVGPAATASGKNAIALGNGATASDADSVALGQGAVTAAANKVAGATINGTAFVFAGKTPGSVVSFGAAGSERQLTNVAAGQLSATSTDAVNGSQLFASNTAIDSLGNTVTGIGTTVTNIGNTVNNINNGGGIKYFHASSTLADSSATGTDSVAVGPAAVASGKNAIALGNGATASDADSVALGQGAVTAAPNKVAGATINGTAFVFAGKTPGSVVSLGDAGAERQLTNVAAGQLSATSTDAVNGSQLFASNTAIDSLGTTVTGIGNTITNINNGAGIKYFHTKSTLADSSATGTDSVAVGPAAVASANNAIALGNGATASDADSVALGQGAVTAAANKVAGATINGTAFIFAGKTPGSVVSLGDAGSERQLTNVAAGQLSATSTDAVNGSQLFASNTAIDSLGNTVNNINNGAGIKYFHTKSTLADSSATGTDSVAVGPAAVASANNAIALGNGATASDADSVALGQGAVTAAANKVNGATINGTAFVFAGKTPGSVVSLGDAGAERQLTNVAAGRLSSTSTDAVNGSQLFASNTAIDSLGNTVTGIGTTVTNIGNTVNNINNGAGIKYFHTKSTLADSSATGTDSVAVGPAAVASANNAIALGNGATASDADSVALGQGAVTAAANKVSGATINSTAFVFAGKTPGSVVSFGAAGSERQLTNVAAGQLSATSTDAVNGSQLFASNTAIDSLGTTVTGIGNTITNINNGAGIKYFHTKSTLADSSATGTDSVAVGPAAVASANNAIALGNGATASDADSVALGQGAVTAAANKVSGATINGTAFVFAGKTPGSVVSFGAAGSERQLTNVAAGQLSAISTDAVNGSQLFASNTAIDSLGNTVNNINNGGGIKYFHASSTLADSSATGTDSVAVGPAAVASGKNAIALGNGATASDADSVALGQGAVTAAANKVSGATINGTAFVFAGKTPGSVVSLGDAGSERQLTNVAAGQLSATSTDAVNGSQLFASNTAIDSLGTTVTGIGNTITNINNGAGIKYFHTKSTLADSSATGTDSVAVGPAAAASGKNAIALGNGATASDADSVALGQGAVTAAANKVAGATINGTAFVFAGKTPGSVVSFGAAGSERQLTNVAAGQLSATSTDAVNGSQLFASNTAIDSLGNTVNNINNGGGIKYFHASSTLADSSATGTDSVAVGPAAAASGKNAIALGNGAAASDANSVALGQGAVTAAANKVAGATINGTAFVFAGKTPGSVVSFGAAGAERQLTNVAAGQLSATSTDAVNGSQLFASNTAIDSLGNTVTGIGTTVTNIGNTINNINNGGGIKYFHASSTLADSSATGTDSVAVGPAAVASGNNAIALGNGATASDADSVALGQGAVTAAANKVTGATINGTAFVFAGKTPGSVVSFGDAGAERQLTNVAAGQLSATSTDAVNGSQLFASNTAINSLGNQVTNIDGRVTTIETSINGGGGVKYFHANSTAADSVAKGTDSVAVGPQAESAGNNAIAMGNKASASADNSVALGSNASDGGRGAESYTGKYSNVANTSTGTVSIGNALTGDLRTLSNLADGREATDAVNLRQLDGAVLQANQYTDNSVKQINGDIISNHNDITNLQNGTDGMFQVNNTSRRPKPQPVGTDSTAGGSGSRAEGNNSVALGANAVATAEDSVALGTNSVANRKNTVSVGSSGHERQITNVAEATEDTDAVNYSQLRKSVDSGVSQANSYTDNRINNLKQDLYKQDDVLSAGVASAMAMANQPQPISAGDSMVTLSSGNYRGESAMALGFSRVSDNGRWVTKMQASTNTEGDTGVGVGVGLEW